MKFMYKVLCCKVYINIIKSKKSLYKLYMKLNINAYLTRNVKCIF